MTKLTTLSHGGGCGCKIAPDILSEITQSITGLPPSDQLIVGYETADDAAVYRLDDNRGLVASVDFFMPIVDDARDFGRIAAANAISDVYAMGAKPLFAMNIIGMPMSKLSPSVVATVLAGGAEVCQQASVVVAGGHSIDTSEPIYGLSVIGMIDLQYLKTNAAAQAGDVLILGKPLGVGILATALRQGKLNANAYREMIDWATKLNRVGEQLASIDGIHAMTDVTGFGLLGHVAEICRASSLGAEVCYHDVPFIEAACDLVRQGFVTGAGPRNLKACSDCLSFQDGLEEWQLALLSDPQTSGGLLLTCAKEVADQVLALLHRQGFSRANIIGTMRQATTSSINISL